MANRRSLIELKFKIADRLTDPTLGFFMWNLNIQQLECPRGSPRSMLRRAEPTNWTPAIEPFNPNVARALYSDGFLIGIWIEIIFNIFGEGKFWLVCWSSDVYAAPAGCLQYFPQPEGIIESFNYNGGTGPYLPNQDYAICFRRREEDTKLLWVFFFYSNRDGRLVLFIDVPPNVFVSQIEIWIIRIDGRWRWSRYKLLSRHSGRHQIRGLSIGSIRPDTR